MKKAQSDGDLLDSSAVLAHASRADLQTTAVRMRIEALKTELYTRDPPCVQMSKLLGAIERAAKQVDAKKEALAKATAET